MIAYTSPRNEGILQLLHGGPIVYCTTTGVILSPFSSLADFDRISTNVAILVRATCQPCIGASSMSTCKFSTSSSSAEKDANKHHQDCLRVVFLNSTLALQHLDSSQISTEILCDSRPLWAASVP